ncbi:hypothetical protein GCM10009647_056930 [Streptomyces sanglieri]
MSSFGTEADSALFNAEITPSEHPAVVYRQDIDVYHGRFDRYQLSWDPETELESEYNRVYDNDRVIMFEANNSSRQ